MSLKFKTFPWADIQFKEIETVEGSPRIYLTPEGDFPSMTSILGVLDDGGIQDWIDKVGQEEANRICQEAGARGNQLHDTNELYLRNELTRDMIKGQGGVLFNRVKKYLDQIKLVVACEVALYSKTLQYAGRTDAIGVMEVEQEERLCIIDHKNSRKPINLSRDYGRKKLWSYMVQCTGYRRALYEMTGLYATHGCLIVGNHSTSNAERFIFEIGDVLDTELELVAKSYHHKYVDTNLNFFKIGTEDEEFPRIFK